MTYGFDSDPEGCILEFAYLLNRTEKSQQRSEWVMRNANEQRGSMCWHNEAVSKHRLLIDLVPGRDPVAVQRTLDKVFFTLELKKLLEPYYPLNGMNQKFEYKQLTHLGEELLLEGSYLEYIHGLTYVLNKYKNSIAKIYHPTDQGIGTGFLVTKNTIATARHVLSGLREFEICLGSQIVKQKKVHYPTAHPDLDLALIELDQEITDIRPIRLANACELLDEVVVVGYPPIPSTRDAYLVANRGEISALVHLQNALPAIVISCLLRGGNSGGPVLNRRGQAVGVISRNLYNQMPAEERDLSQGLGFATAFPSSGLSALIERVT